MTGRAGRLAVWLLLAVVAAGTLAVAAAGDGGPRTPEDRSRALAATIRCPTCRGQSVLESDAPTARAIREEISRRVESGQTDDQIRAYLVSVHGPSVLLNPPRSGVAGLVWVLPVAAVVAAVVGLAAAFRRWRAPPPEVDPADLARVEQALRERS